MGGFGNFSVGNLKEAAQKRSEKAKAKLDEKAGTSYTPEQQAAFPSLTAGSGDPQDGGQRSFLGNKLRAAEAAAGGAPVEQTGEQAGQDGSPGGSAGPAGAPAGPQTPDAYDRISGGTYGLFGGQNMAQKADERVHWKEKNKLHDDTEERIGVGLEVNEKRKPLAGEVYEAEMGRAAATADGMDLIAETQLDIEDRRMETERLQAERHVKIEETVQKYETKMSEAVAQMQNRQRVDPSAGWTNKSAGQKIRMTLAAMFRGGAGRDPMAYITRAVSQEVDAQKSNAQMDMQTAGMTLSAYKTATTGVRDSFLAINADERTADKMTEIAMFESAKSQLIAAQSHWDAQGTNAHASQALNELDETIAARKLELKTMEASNPKYFHRSAYKHGKYEREFMQNVAKQDVENMGEAQKAKIGRVADLQDAEAAIRAAGPQDPTVAGLDQHSRARITKHTEDAQNKALYSLKRQIQGILAQEDIPGVKWAGADLLGADAAQFEQMNLTMGEDMQKAFSGAGGSEDEATRHVDMLTGHINDKLNDPISFFASDGGEERYRKNLKIALQRVETKLATARRGLDQKERNMIDRQTNPDYIGEGGFDRGYGLKKVTDSAGNVTVDSSEYE